MAAMRISAGPTPPAGPAAGVPAGRRRGDRGGRLWRAVRSNRKADRRQRDPGRVLRHGADPRRDRARQPARGRLRPQPRPVAQHLLGTTAYGQDIFSQVIWGTRQTLIIALVVGLISTVISVMIGVGRGLPGRALGRRAQPDHRHPAGHPDVPAADRDRRLPARQRADRPLIAVLVITGWSYSARQLRAQALSLRNRDFLEAARVRGERRIYIIVVEIIPTMTSLIVADFLGTARLRRARRRRPAVHRPGRPEHAELGHDALLGGEERGAADRPVPVGDRARRLASRCSARRSPCSTTPSTRSATRRCGRCAGTGEPVPAPRAERPGRPRPAWPALRRRRSAWRSATCPSSTPPSAARGRRRPRQLRPAPAASSSASSASPAAASPRCCSRSPSCWRPRPTSPAAA